MNFQIGNVPLGNVIPICIDSILCSRSSKEFTYDEAGTIYLQYSGIVEADLPSIGPMEIPVYSSAIIAFSLPPSWEETIHIARNELTPFTLVPSSTIRSGKLFSMEVDAIEFEKCELFIDLFFYRCGFSGAYNY
ncbi:MAG: hypothetical protein LUE93_07180 [Bacteroides sp.]|nr:hypothetical protein [Bacteroides sp.]